jgi:hypothetical protein
MHLNSTLSTLPMAQPVGARPLGAKPAVQAQPHQAFGLLFADKGLTHKVEKGVIKLFGEGGKLAAVVSREIAQDETKKVIIGQTPKGDFYGGIIDRVTQTFTQIADRANVQLGDSSDKTVRLFGQPADFTREQIRKAAKAQVDDANSVFDFVKPKELISTAPDAGKGTGSGWGWKTTAPVIPLGDAWHSITSLFVKSEHAMGAKSVVLSTAEHVDEAVKREVQRANVPEGFVTFVPNGQNGDLAPLLTGIPDNHSQPVVHTYLDLVLPSGGTFTREALTQASQKQVDLAIGGSTLNERAEQKLYGNFALGKNGKVINFKEKPSVISDDPSSPDFLPRETHAGLGKHLLSPRLIQLGKQHFSNEPPVGDTGGLFKGLLPALTSGEGKHDLGLYGITFRDQVLDFGNKASNLAKGLVPGRLTAPDLNPSRLPDFRPDQDSTALVEEFGQIAKKFLDARGYNPEGNRSNLQQVVPEFANVR